MTRRTYIGGIAAVCATMLVSTGLLVAQDKPYDKEMSPEEQAMMEKWQAYMTPGQYHEQLAARTGEWTYVAKFWEQPGAEPQISEGEATAKMILDGRYLLEKVEGPFMGMPFKGIGIFGYDNMTQEFTGIWVDNMSTGIMHYSAPPSDGAMIKWTGQQPDVMTGEYGKVVSTDKMLDENTKLHEGYNFIDGEKFKTMEITYTRK